MHGITPSFLRSASGRRAMTVCGEGGPHRQRAGAIAGGSADGHTGSYTSPLLDVAAQVYCIAPGNKGSECVGLACGCRSKNDPASALTSTATHTPAKHTDILRRGMAPPKDLISGGQGG